MESFSSTPPPSLRVNMKIIRPFLKEMEDSCTNATNNPTERSSSVSLTKQNDASDSEIKVSDSAGVDTSLHPPSEISSEKIKSNESMSNGGILKMISELEHERDCMHMISIRNQILLDALVMNVDAFLK